MPSSDFKCSDCLFRMEVHFTGQIPDTFEQRHSKAVDEQCPYKTLDRVWTSFHAGRGTSGGTPPR